MNTNTLNAFTRRIAGLLGLVTVALASQPALAVDCNYAVIEEWNAGYKAEISIVNDGEAFNSWTISWPLGDGESFSSGWNANYDCSGGTCTATPPNWNPTIQNGETYTFGLIINKGSAAANPGTIVSGDVCDNSPPLNPDAVLWQLDQVESSLYYVSIKKEHTAETNTFLAQPGEPGALAGSITADGAVVFSIDLNDVDTGIEIRNSRLLNFLFETELLPTAYLRATLDNNVIDDMAVGDVLPYVLLGEFSLHAVSQPVAADVLIAKTAEDELWVTTIQPVNISSDDFDMAVGIETLRQIAGLSSVGKAVPVYFQLRFVANTDPELSAVAMPPTPAEPSNLSGTFGAATEEANLDWQDNSINETGYLVRRRPADGDWQTVAELVANSSSLSEGLPEAGEFDYKVIALNEGVPSAPSNIERVIVTASNQLVRGQHIYEGQCAGCHGADGEGTTTAPALDSERDVAAMIAYIEEFMPFGDTASCDQACAEDVATFIQTLWVTAAVCDPALTPVAYGARQLKILTHNEYQRSVEDLIGIDYEVVDGLSADSKVGLFTNNTHAPVLASSYSNFLLVAEEVAEWSADRDFAPALNCSNVDQSCADQLINELAPKIFRRPLTTDEADTYQDMADGNHTSGNIHFGIKMALEAMLASPQFLYRHELGEPNPDNPELDSDGYELTSWEMATFLAYTFTGSTPDQALLDAAAADELRNEANIIAQAQRLAANAKPVLGDFVGSWLGTADLENAAKDPNVFPGFQDLVPHMKGELNETFAKVMSDPLESFNSLYAGDFTFLNQTLAEHYGLSGVATGDELQQVQTTERGGILAGGAFMARWAESVETSPILRSVRVRRRVLCQDQPDPPAGTFAAREAKLAELSEFLQDPETTNRMKYHRLTEDSPCTNCHLQYINPLGFGMEDFDTVGRLRSTDQNGNSIDASGELFAPLDYSDLDAVEPFTGARGLGSLLSTLPSAQECLPQQMFRYVTGVGHERIDPANPEGPQLTEEEKSGYACEIDALTDAMMNDSPRAMLERFGSLQAVRYRKAWARD